MIFYNAEQVRAALDPQICQEVMKEAMIALSSDSREQLLRSVVQLENDLILGVMPGYLAHTRHFGTKTVSVGRDPQTEQHRHKGLVLLFSPDGEPLCAADAEEVTAIRTAATTAVATEALAVPKASRLLIMGCGLQARSHLRALAVARSFDQIRIWARTPERAEALAAAMQNELGQTVMFEPDPELAVRSSDVICTVTSARTPILFREWVRPGTHVNLVGSSIAGPIEVDIALVRDCRYFVDSRNSALRQAAELLVAIEEGVVDESHIAGEIGHVLAGERVGRRNETEITLYKSLGHVVQDLAAVLHVHRSSTGPASSFEAV